MNKQEELDKIAREIEACKVCRIGKSGKAVVGEGNPDAEVVFIGEAPGKNEALVGRPFIGRSGKLLRSMITSIGLLESEVYITSPVKYLPDVGTPSPSDIAHGRTHLMKQLAIISPRFVVLLGRVAAEGVLTNEGNRGDSRLQGLALEAQSRLRGVRKVFVMKEHGEVIDSRDGVSYLLTLHPAAAIRFQKNRPLFESDFQKLKSLM